MKLLIFGLLVLCVQYCASTKLVNVALKKKAYQMDTFSNNAHTTKQRLGDSTYTADKAVDGNVGTVAKQQYKVDYWAWFMVDLGSIYKVSYAKVTVFQTFVNRFVYPEIWISTQSKYSGSGNIDWSEYKKCTMHKRLFPNFFSGNRGENLINEKMICTGKARYVVIRALVYGGFFLNEFMVFAKKAAGATLVNVALKKKVYCYPDFYKRSSYFKKLKNLVDGIQKNLAETNHLYRIYHYNTLRWWMVDLGSTYQVSYVNAHNFRPNNLYTISLSEYGEYSGKSSQHYKKYKRYPEPDWSQFTTCAGKLHRYWMEGYNLNIRCIGRARYVALRFIQLMTMPEVRVFGKKAKTYRRMKESNPYFFKKLGSPSSQFYPSLMDYENNKLLSSRAVNCALQCLKLCFDCCHGIYFNKNNGKCNTFRAASLSKMDANSLWNKHYRIM